MVLSFFVFASDEFLDKWKERNEEQDLMIVERISVLGFLMDKDKSHKIVEWAYKKANGEGYILWK